MPLQVARIRRWIDAVEHTSDLPPTFPADGDGDAGNEAVEARGRKRRRVDSGNYGAGILDTACITTKRVHFEKIPAAHPATSDYETASAALTGEGDDNDDDDDANHEMADGTTTPSEPSRRGKRGRLVLDQTPFPNFSPLDADADADRNSTIKKPRRATSPIKKSSDLFLLEKPVYIRDFAQEDDAAALPSDVQGLYDEIAPQGDFKQHIFPMEIRREIEAFVKKTLPDLLFREGEADANADADAEGARSRALEEFGAVQAILGEAAKSARLQRYEDGWNHFVHTPLLRLVFDDQLATATVTATASATASAIKSATESAPPPPRRFEIRTEAVMSATIAYDWIPRLHHTNILSRPPAATPRQDTKDQQENDSSTSLSDLACSVSITTESTTHNSNTNSLPPPPPTALFATSDKNKHLFHSTSDSKKVDYAIILDLSPSTPLSILLKSLLFLLLPLDRQEPTIFNRSSIATTIPSVNQTSYASIRHSPIAISIETKQADSSRDALLQLGIWTAAWHKRLEALRVARGLQLLDTAYHQSPDSIKINNNDDDDNDVQSTSEEEKYLPSLPLIVSKGHTWELYLAVDRRESIVLLGPLSLGSTKSVYELYMLVCTLRVLRGWIETQFYRGLCRWLECEE